MTFVMLNKQSLNICTNTACNIQAQEENMNKYVNKKHRFFQTHENMEKFCT